MHYRKNFKISDHKILILNPAKYCIAHRHRLHGYMDKLLSNHQANLSPKNFENLEQLSGLTPDPSWLQKNKCIPNMLIFHIDVWQNFNVF